MTNFDGEIAGGCRRRRRRAGEAAVRSVRRKKDHGKKEPPALSCTTFNILAPIYKRLGSEDPSCRESEHRAVWLARNRMIADYLLARRSSIICLQEVWLGNDELVGLYSGGLERANYSVFTAARTNNRGDGLLTAVDNRLFTVLSHRELQFNDVGDRVAQLLHVEMSASPGQQMLIVNTHLLFPHDHSLSIVRLKQVYKILQYIEAYQKENKLRLMPILLCGDWNGSKHGHVYKFLRSQGFVSSFDTVHQYTDSDAQKWVSHRNHHGNICGVDFIWLLNPNKRRKPLKNSWNDAVFSIIKSLLLRLATLAAGNNACALFKGDGDEHGDGITVESFCRALIELELVHPDRLDAQDIEGLWLQADTDGDGVLDCKELQRCIWSEVIARDQESDPAEVVAEEQQEVPGLAVKAAELYPPEAEKGVWPESYSLSDHAPLTAVFTPVKLRCCHPPPPPADPARGE